MFHRMPRRDLLLLATLAVLAAVGFLVPSLREDKAFGVALFGWWMAGLMVAAPVLALLVGAAKPE